MPSTFADLITRYRPQDAAQRPWLLTMDRDDASYELFSVSADVAECELPTVLQRDWRDDALAAQQARYGERRCDWLASTRQMEPPLLRAYAAETVRLRAQRVLRLGGDVYAALGSPERVTYTYDAARRLVSIAAATATDWRTSLVSHENPGPGARIYVSCAPVVAHSRTVGHRIEGGRLIVGPLPEMA